MDPLDCAVAAAEEAGAILLARFGGPLEVEHKSSRADLVTDADRASEAAIVARIRAAFPQATIVGEESGTHPGSSDERWFIDPLDGTTNFAHAYPMFCVSIAYERAGELIAGVILAPKLGETYMAERGSGARRNGEVVRTSRVAALGDALACTGYMPGRFDDNAAQFAAIARRAQALRRDGSAALDLAFVACGRFDAFWEFGLHAWDVAAGALLVREAGGRVDAIDGSALDLERGSILATNGLLHAELRAELERAARA